MVKGATLIEALLCLLYVSFIGLSCSMNALEGLKSTKKNLQNYQVDKFESFDTEKQVLLLSPFYSFLN